MAVDLVAIALLTTLLGAEPGSQDEVMLWRYAGTVRVHDSERQVSLAVLDGLSPDQDFALKTGYRVESNGGFEVSIGKRATIDVRGADTLTVTAIDAGSASFRFGSGRNVIFKLNGLILTAEFPGELMLATESQGESLIQVATIGENLLVKNIQGADVLIYRGNDPLHRLEAGNRLEVPIAAAATPPPTGGSFSGSPPDQKDASSAPADSSPGQSSPEPTRARVGETLEGPRSLVWGTQVVRLPQGVRGFVRQEGGSSRLELERDPGASGIAVVKLGSARLLMGPGARLVINEAGRVIAVQGQVIGGRGVVGLGASAGGSGGGFGGAGFVAPNPYEQSNEYSPGHDG